MTNELQEILREVPEPQGLLIGIYSGSWVYHEAIPNKKFDRYSWVSKVDRSQFLELFKTANAGEILVVQDRPGDGWYSHVEGIWRRTFK